MRCHPLQPSGAPIGCWVSSFVRDSLPHLPVSWVVQSGPESWKVLHWHSFLFREEAGCGGHGSIGCYAVAALQRMHCDLFCKVKQFWVTLRAMFERKTISGFLTERLMICSDTHGQAAPRRDLATCTTTHLETLTKAALEAAAGGPAATNVSSRLVAACQVFAWNWSCVWARP